VTFERVSARPGPTRVPVWAVLPAALTVGLLAPTPAPAQGSYNPPYHTSDGTKYGSPNIYAIRPPDVFYHNVGLLELFITNIGRVGNGQLQLDSVSAGWRGGEYLYIGAMWIGAIASDNLAYCTTGGYDFELLPSQDPIDTIYPAYEGVAGGNRPGFSPTPDDDGDGATDEEFLNGRDDDGDGRIDEDYAAYSQQMYSCEYWDYTEEARNLSAEHRPLNVRVRQRSYAWSTEGSNEFVGFDFDIINDGFEVLRQVYLGFFVDSDAGPKATPNYWTDDGGRYFPIDTTFSDPTVQFTCQPGGGETKDCSILELEMDVMAMFDRPDDGQSANGGDVDGWFGGMFLGHTTDPVGERAPARVQMHTARFFSGNNPYPNGDPRNDAERYDLLQSGDANERETTAPDDYRYVFSAGPFRELNPGDQLQLQVAFVAGLGFRGMITNAINAQRIYNGKWRDLDGSVETGVDGRETCLKILEPGDQVFWRDPCDSLNPETKLIKELVCLPENYVDNDCNCCTPLFLNASEAGSNGFESLIHWVGTVAPPPPGTNMEAFTDPCSRRSEPGEGGIPLPAGDRRNLIQWDNQSELVADPILQRVLFAGYKLWRVEGWNRPVGAAGPRPNDWQLVADLSLEPADGKGADSPNYLLKYREDYDGVVSIDSLCAIRTGSVDQDSLKWYYPVGRYSYTDTLGLKNGMLYFYDVTAYSLPDGVELSSLPTAVERDAVVPIWSAGDGLDGVIVVPNPYVDSRNPAGWDLDPSDSDPTGTKIAFAQLPRRGGTVKIFSLAGDLVETLTFAPGDGSVFWNLVSRNGQDVVAGIYIYSVESGGKSKVGRFVVVR